MKLIIIIIIIIIITYNYNACMIIMKLLILEKLFLKINRGNFTNEKKSKAEKFHIVNLSLIVNF